MQSTLLGRFKLPPQPSFEVVVPMDGNLDPGIDPLLCVAVITAADSCRAPAAGLEQPASLPTVEGPHTATSMTLSAPEVGISEAFTDRHPSIASRMFSSMSSSDSPWERHRESRSRPPGSRLRPHPEPQSSVSSSLLLVLGSGRIATAVQVRPSMLGRSSHAATLSLSDRLAARWKISTTGRFRSRAVKAG